MARESIRDLVARYNANGDSGRFTEVLQCFAPDAVMEIGGRAYRSRQDILRIFTDAAEAARRWPEPVTMRHHTSTLQMDVVGPNEASSRCYYQVLTAKGLDHWGRYLDSYKLWNGTWHFAYRREFLDGTVPGSWAEFAQSPHGLLEEGGAGA